VVLDVVLAAVLAVEEAGWMMEEPRGRGKEAEGRRGSPAGSVQGSPPAPAAAATAGEPRQQRWWC